jgi:hypothetical protein
MEQLKESGWSGAQMIEVAAPLIAWRPSDPSSGGWHFVSVAGDPAAEIRFAALGTASSFGSVRVTAVIEGTKWKTSLFPQKETGGFLLPVKAEVRRREALSARRSGSAPLACR